MDPVPLWQTVLFQLCLIGLTALFTLLESAAESLTESRLERLREEGDAHTDRMRAQLPHGEAALSAVQTGLCFLAMLSGCVAALGWAGTLKTALTGVEPLKSLSAEALFRLSLILILLLICFFTRLLGVELPRRMAALHADGVLRALFGPMVFVRRLFVPMTALIGKASGAVMRLMGIDPDQATEQVTADEIMAMVDIGEEKGSIERNEKELIENIFEFNSMTAEDCMIHRTDVTAIDVDISDGELIDLIRETGFSRFPVYDRDIDDIVGILTTRSYLLNARLEPEKRKTLRELIRPAYFVPESVRTDVLFREMQSRKSHMAIVVDEYGGTSGLITLEDLLEEIVGNIYDEFDPQDKQDIVPQADGSWRVAGSVELDRLCEALGIEEIDDDEFDTLGGLIFSRLTAIPDDGSHPEVDCFGLHIRVDELTDRRVEWATITKTPEEPGDTAREER